MNARAVLKLTAPAIARYSGVAKALALRYGGPGIIFMLHSTVGSSDQRVDKDLRCPVSALERSLRWLKDNDVEFVSLDEAVKRLDRPSPGKFCAFTFDDGYADNLTHALPVMERFGAPFTVYITTGMRTGTIDAWWLGIAALISARDHIELPGLDCKLDCGNWASKQHAYAEITALVHADYAALAPVRAAIAAAGIDYGALAQRQALSAEQIRTLAASPLVTIGAHGDRHINLARATADEAELDVVAGRRQLEDIIDRAVVHFAYPFGDARACGAREAQIARAAGFRTAVTTRHGTLFPQHRDDLCALPREPLRGDDTPASLRCKLAGFYRAFYSGLGDPVARM